MGSKRISLPVEGLTFYAPCSLKHTISPLNKSLAQLSKRSTRITAVNRKTFSAPSGVNR
jgi:hypothetical protein